MLTPSCFMVRIAATICSTIFGDSPSEGSSSSTSDGLPIRVRAMVSICCSPPLMRPPGRLRISARFGNSVNSFSRVQCGAFGLHRLAADFEIFVDREIGEDAPLFRHIAEAAADDRMGRLIRDVLALEHDAAAALRDQPDDGAKGGGLAGAVAPEQCDHLALADLERDVEQDVGGAVMAVEILNAELHDGAPSRWRAS